MAGVPSAPLGHRARGKDRLGGDGSGAPVTCPSCSVRRGALPDVHPEHHAAHAECSQARLDEGGVLLR